MKMIMVRYKFNFMDPLLSDFGDQGCELYQE